MAGSGVSLFSPLPVGELSGSPAGVFTQALFSALRASHFLLLRQKKVSKEKATPGSAPGYARSLALLAAGWGCGTRACGPQTVLALFPPAAALLSASQGDPKGVPGSGTVRNTECCGRRAKRPKNENRRSSLEVFPGPLGGAEQRRKAGGSRRGLSEGRSPEFRSRALSDATHREEVLLGCPAFRVAQGTRAAGADPGSPFLCLLSFGEAKESKTPRKGGTLRQQRNQHSKETT